MQDTSAIGRAMSNRPGRTSGFPMRVGAAAEQFRSALAGRQTSLREEGLPRVRVTGGASCGRRAYRAEQLES